MGKKYNRPIYWLVICGALLIAAVAIGTAITMGQFRDRALADSERELQNTALILAEQTDRSFQALDLVLASITERIESLGVTSSADFKRQLSGQDVHLMLKDKVGGLPHVDALTLIDADGKMVSVSRSWPTPDINIADRKHFKAFVSDPQLTSFVSEPVRNRATGTWTFFVIRKLSARNGEFLGLVHGAIELEYFEKFFSSIVLGEQSSISLFRRDGTLLVRYPHIESAIGASFRGAIDSLKDGNAGTTRLIGKMQNRDILIAAHALEHYPLVIAVGIDVESALAEWRREAQFLIIGGSLSVLAICIMFFLIVRQLLRGHNWSKQRLALEKWRLHTAINNMTQGLLLFDSSERIVVINDRYIEMYGLSAEVAKAGCTLRELIHHRKETGSFAGDVDKYRSSLLNQLVEGKASELTTNNADGRCIRIVNQPLAGGGWVATHEDITERKRVEERIEHLAHYDALTNLPNRELFHERLEQSLKLVRRGGRLALLYFDLDQFKSVNDTLGHQVGDSLLKAVAGRLSGCLRETDTIARLGGDEFAIIQTAIDQPTDTADLVKRLCEALREPYLCDGHQLTTDASIGIAIAPENGTRPDELLKNADLAMYGAKADGRGTYRFFEREMDLRVKARRALEFDLRQAVMCGDFKLHYQPLVNLLDNRVIGCEALLRWDHPERGMIPPAEFIPIAEETGLITSMGEWALRTACAEAMTWPDDIKVAVNVSPVQFDSGNLVQMVINALATSRLPAHRLELEITEAVIIRDYEATLAVLHQLRQLGVRIAMDDFGTGYSSLGYLHRFPFDKIKIDRSFIKDVAEKDGSFSIVQAVVSIAKSRNITTTAEGVETELQLETLRRLGCTEMQGYIFSPALPAEELFVLFPSYRQKAETAA
jgi:diguanylate cyclase (GGDEF)-like protein/PAS domain S-box-containing protein